MPSSLTSAAFLMALLFSIAPPAAALGDEKSPPRTITVSGSGEVRVEPDEVILRFGIQGSDKTLRVAKSASDKAMQEVLKVLSGLGVKPVDIQTDELNVEPQFAENSRRRGAIVSFWVSRGITVHLRDVSKFEDVVQGLFEAGVNQFEGLEFRSSELKKHREAARELAMKAAHEKGVKMSAVLNQKIGRPLTITEQSDGWWGSRSSRNIGNSSMQQVSVATDGGEPNGDTFARGRIMIKAAVSVVFELE